MIWQVLLTPSLPSLAGGGTLKLYSNDDVVTIAYNTDKTWNYGEPFILSIGLYSTNTNSRGTIVLDGITIYDYGYLWSGEAGIRGQLHDFVDTISEDTVYGLSFPVYDHITITNYSLNADTLSLFRVRVYKYVTD